MFKVWIFNNMLYLFQKHVTGNPHTFFWNHSAVTCRHWNYSKRLFIGLGSIHFYKWYNHTSAKLEVTASLHNDVKFNLAFNDTFKLQDTSGLLFSFSVFCSWVISGWVTREMGFNSQQMHVFFSCPQHETMTLTWISVQLVSRDKAARGKKLNIHLPASAQVKNLWRYTFTPLYIMT